MKKIVSILLSLILVLISLSAFAGTVNLNGTLMEYNSVEELEEIFKSVRNALSVEHNILLLDHAQFNHTSYIVGETFPAGRYYVYPVVVADENTHEYAQVQFWYADEVDNEKYSDYVCAAWCYTIELTDGMKVKFSWSENEIGTCIAMEKMPDKVDSLMDAFGN